MKIFYTFFININNKKVYYLHLDHWMDIIKEKIVFEYNSKT